MPPPSHPLPRRVAVHIGRRAQALREERSWSRYYVEKETGIAQNTLKAIEEGETEPTLATLFTLLDLFDLCSIEELLGGPLGTTEIRRIIGKEATT